MEFFELRENQKEVINTTSNFFKNNNSDIYLWAIKCRWGKTFAAYNLAKSFYNNKPMKILVLTYKPTVGKEWKDNLENHVYFKDWKYFTKDKKKSFLSSTAPVSVLFMSFQSLISKNGASFNFKSDYYKWVGDVDFDFLFVDEAHFGASNPFCIDFCKNKINAKYRLFMSGTPFTAVRNQYFKYYSAYDCTDEDNHLKLFHVKESISSRGKDIISFLKTTNHNHIICYVEDVAACISMSHKLKGATEFKVIDCYGVAGNGGNAMIKKIQNSIATNKRTVTITCGMAMTGTTIPQWDCILFYGCDYKYMPDSPSTFFQTLFRITTSYKNKTNVTAYFFGKIESIIFKYHEYSRCIAATKRINFDTAFSNLIEALPIIDNGEVVDYFKAKLIAASDSYKDYVSWYKQKMFLLGLDYDDAEVA